MDTSDGNRWSCPSSDSDFYSVSSPETISPAPSMDQSFSPTYKSEGAIEKKRRPRLKNQIVQRQNASEKEKLRIRDLTKALHHLRTYLPPSVAPVGQTLTKIETLRLTIRYISFLSAQLGFSEEGPCSPDMLGYFQCRSRDGQWSERGQGYGHWDQESDGSGHVGQCVEMNVERYKPYTEQNILQSQQWAQTTHTYQVYGRNFVSQLVPQAHWS